MPNDAKLGMIVGVGVVLAIALVFFRKDPASNLPPTGEAAAAAVVAPPAAPQGTSRGSYRPVPAKTAIQNDTSIDVLRSERHHIVEEGETLFSLAQRYYGDQGRVAEIYQRNRDWLATPDALTPGTVLVLPRLPAGATVPEDQPE